jgi:hypothetical protein
VRAGCTFQGYKDSGLKGAKIEVSAKGKRSDTHKDITGQERDSPNSTKKSYSNIAKGPSTRAIFHTNPHYDSLYDLLPKV